MAIINGTVTDFNNDVYKNRIMFLVNNYYNLAGDEDKANSLIAYPLNSQYKTLKGKIVIPKSYNIATWGERNCDTSATDILVYGDGELLYKAVAVTSSIPFAFEIDVKGVNQLVIKLKAEINTHLALTDLTLFSLYF